MKNKSLKIFLLIIISLFLTKNVFSAPICKTEKKTITEEDNLLKNNETNEVEEITENKDQIEDEGVIKKEEEGDIEISADKTIELDKKKGVMIATGNAFVKEGITKLSADMLTAFSCQTKNGDTQIIQINADGNVIINSDQGNAYAKRGTYFVEEKIIELYDNVKLEKDGDILVGDKGEFNVYTGKGEISVVPTSEGSKRKVYGIIKSKKNNEGLYIKNLQKSYSKNEVLRSINLEVHKSEVVGLLGPNGAGKTTSFHVITGLINSNKGVIIMDGINITDYPIHLRSRLGLGYLPQENSIFRGLTVEENLMSILEYTESNKSIRLNFLEELLVDFSLLSRRKYNVMKLSGGQRRRVEIARALCARPNYLLLDEPFTGIDPMQVKEIKELIKNLKKRRIGILITDHNVREALGIIDRAYIIHDGTVLMHGAPKEIIKNKSVKKVYLGEDFKI